MIGVLAEAFLMDGCFLSEAPLQATKHDVGLLIDRTEDND